jgi:hypothetical protein
VVGDRRHLLAWLLLVDALALATVNFAEQYAALALGLTSRRLSLPGGDLASWLASSTNLPGIVISVVSRAGRSLWLRPSAAGQASFARDQAGLPGGHG